MAETKPKTATKPKTTKPKAAKTTAAPADHTTEAKTRFNAALEEAKAGAAALKAEGVSRAGEYRTQAKDRTGTAVADAKGKASELAVEGKGKASDALASLGKMVADNAEMLDEKFGAQYGDYARSASRSLHENAAKLDNKSVDELGEDAREFVRKSPGLAVGIAAVGGYMIARLLRR